MCQAHNRVCRPGQKLAGDAKTVHSNPRCNEHRLIIILCSLVSLERQNNVHALCVLYSYYARWHPCAINLLLHATVRAG